MKKKVGRPKKEIKTSRVQCIIPETVKQELDKRIELLPKSERDRSKIITTAINEWLKPSRKKRLKNLYIKFFGFIDPFLDKGLFGDLNTIVEKDDDLEILDIIQDKLVSGENPNDDEIERFNNLLAKQKFYIDKSLKLNCTSTQVRILVEMLFLNRSYPMKDYTGYCKECGVFFYKEKAKQLFHSPVCKLKYYEKIGKMNHDPQKESKIRDNKENIRNKALKTKLNISEILRSIDPEKNTIETVKELIKNICILSGTKFSIFKKLWQNSIGKLDEALRLDINFWNEYIDELKRRYTIENLMNYTVENFADDMVKDFFAETGKMKNEFKKSLLKSLTPNRFNARKNFELGFSKLEKEQDCINALNKTIEYYENTFEKEYDLNNDKKLLLEKRNTLILAKMELFQYEKDLDKQIKFYTELLKENRLNLGAYSYLITTFYFNYKKLDKEMCVSKIIYYYKCFRRIKKVSGLLRVNQIKSEKRMFKELCTFPNFLKDYALLTTFTALAYLIKDQTKEALEIMNQPGVKYISDNEKKMAALAYSIIFSNLKNADKGIEYLEKLELQPDLFEENKKRMIERIENS